MSSISSSNGYISDNSDDYISEDSWMDEEAISDHEFILNNKDACVAGYLSIGNDDGLEAKEGNTAELGFRFVRYMYRKFLVDKRDSLNEYQDIIEKVERCYSPSANLGKSLDTFPRSWIDSSVTGWLGHAVTRITGSVCSTFREDGPFFEVLINSAKTSRNSDNCYPFSVSIYITKESAINRSAFLQKVKLLSDINAYPHFYSSDLIKPAQFMQWYKSKTGKDVGPNSKRILQALEFLDIKKMKAQTIGNCWLKQPKRSVLIHLFLQTVTERPELTIGASWKVAHKLYKKWKTHTDNEISDLIKSGGMVRDTIILATQKLELDPVR